MSQPAGTATARQKNVERYADSLLNAKLILPSAQELLVRGEGEVPARGSWMERVLKIRSKLAFSRYPFELGPVAALRYSAPERLTEPVRTTPVGGGVVKAYVAAQDIGSNIGYTLDTEFRQFLRGQDKPKSRMTVSVRIAALEITPWFSISNPYADSKN